MRQNAAAALGQTAVAAALWGTSFPVITVAIKEGLDPVMFVFLRFALAAPLMLAVAVFFHRNVRLMLTSRAVWIVAFLNAVGFLCQYIGQQYTGASVAALLVNLSVVIAAVGGVVFLGEQLGAFRGAGVLLAFLGTALIATKGDLSTVAAGQFTGDGLYLLAALSWGGYIVFAKKKTDESDWDPIAVAASIVTLTAVFIAPEAVLFKGSIPQSTSSWEAIGYTAAFNTAIPFVLYQAGLRHLTATASAVVLMLEIVVAVLISVLFLGETFTASSLLGSFGVLASILLVSGLEVHGKSLSVGDTGAKRVQVFQ